MKCWQALGHWLHTKWVPFLDWVDFHSWLQLFSQFCVNEPSNCIWDWRITYLFLCLVCEKDLGPGVKEGYAKDGCCMCGSELDSYLKTEGTFREFPAVWELRHHLKHQPLHSQPLALIALTLWPSGQLLSVLPWEEGPPCGAHEVTYPRSHHLSPPRSLPEITSLWSGSSQG